MALYCFFTEYLSDLCEEYGPTFIDSILESYPARIFRRLRRRAASPPANHQKKVMMLWLPDELLWKICMDVVTLETLWCPTHGSNCPRIPKRLSAIANLSATCRRFRELIGPSYTQVINVRGAWCRTARSIRTIAESHFARECTTSLKIQPYLGPGKGWKPPRHLPSNLATGIMSLSMLSSLTLNMPEYRTSVFQRAFERREFSLPKLDTLVLGPHMEWIIRMCPNVQIISTAGFGWLHSDVDGDYSRRHSTELIRAAGKAEKLKHFEMHEFWERRFLWAIRAAMPRLSSFAMPGGRYNQGLTELLPVLKRFKCLKTLALSDVVNLDVGFYPPGCGNAYLEPGGDEYLKSIQSRARGVSETVASLVLTEMECLEAVWIGNSFRAVPVRNASGAIYDVALSHERRQNLGHDY